MSYRHAKHIISALILIMGVFVAPTFAQSDTSSTDTTTSTPTLNSDALDTYLRAERDAHGLPSLAVAVVQGDEVTYMNGFGAVSEDTPVYIGSISKTFTAIAILQLVEAGDVDLDTPINAYLPDLTLAEGDVNSITVRHLLNQTSGMNGVSLSAEVLRGASSTDAVVEALAQATMRDEAGTEFAYFNPNYVLLGGIIEQVAETSYADYVRANILTPLEMTNTTFMRAEDDDVGQGYLMAFSNPLPYDERNDVPHASGGIVSTARDMGRFVSALLNPSDAGVITPFIVEQMTTLPESAPDSTYGMGLYHFGDNEDSDVDAQVWMHAGDLYTYHADMIISPEEGVGFVLLYDMNNLVANWITFPDIAQGTLDVMRGQNVEVGGLNLRIIGIGIAFFGIISIIGDVFRLLGVPFWVRKHRERSWMVVTLKSLGRVFPLIFVLILPMLLGWIFGTSVTYEDILTKMPDVTVLLFAGMVLGILTYMMRLLIYGRVHGRMLDREA
jgi:CubicO group peptidase (beta-lactamase class C family)